MSNFTFFISPGGALGFRRRVAPGSTWDVSLGTSHGIDLPVSTQLQPARADTGGVSLPRQVLPGTTYLLTRRVAQRQFLLTPSGTVNGVLRYCLHRAAKIYGVEVHAVQAPSNHVHILATDVRGELPGFMAWFDREVAKCMNEHYDRAEAFWSSDHYSAVALIDAESVIAKLVYVFVNVVKAGLVRTYRDWPGVTSSPRDWLRPPSSVARPEVHFDQDDVRWAEVEACFTVPPALRDREIDELVASVEASVADEERALRELARREGRAFRGADRCAKQDPFGAPETKQAKGRLSPTFAAGTAEGQKRARDMLRHFRSAYREALEKFRRRAGCVFPAGTYWLVRLASVCCAPLHTARPVLDST